MKVICIITLTKLIRDLGYRYTQNLALKVMYQQYKLINSEGS